jgi:hypothetical protein
MSPRCSKPAADGAAWRISVLPNAKYLDGTTPSIELAGKRWPIPSLKGHSLEMVLWAFVESRPKARRFI